MDEILFQWKLQRIKKRGEKYKQIKEIEDAYVEYLPENKKKKVSNIMLVVSTIAIIGYVIANYILQYNTGVELSPTITPYWFAFWTGEIFILAGIRITKVFKGSDEC